MQHAGETDEGVLTRALRVIATLTLALGVIFALLPSDSTPYSTVDDTWIVVLHDAHTNDRRFGQEVVFTFGPLGFAFDGFTRETARAQLIVWTILAVLYIAVLQGISSSFRMSVGLHAAAIIVFLIAPSDAKLLFGSIALAVCFALDDDHPNAMIIGGAAGVAAAVGSLIKFSCLVAAIPLLILATFRDLMRRRVPVAALAFMGGLLASWIAAGQRMGDLVPWLARSFEFVSGYESAMTGTESAEPFAVASHLIAAGAILAATAAIRSEPGNWTSRLPVLAIGWILFVSTKTTFVRYDPQHAETGPVILVLVALCLTAVAARGKSSWGKAIAAGALIISIAAAWTPVMALQAARESLGPLRERMFHSRMARVAPSARPSTFRMQRSPRIPAQLFDPPIESVDLFSVGHRSILARGIELRPRPVFQSYAAYTRGLQILNADYLRSDEAPRSLLLLAATLDGRYPSFDDSLSIPVFMSHFAVRSRHDEWLRLDRRTTPRNVTFGESISITGAMHRVQPLPQPHAGPLWAEITVKPTLVGRLHSTLWRSHHLLLIIERDNGALGVFRFLPTIAESGFLLSPVIDSAEFLEAGLDGKTLPGSGVVAFMVRPFDSTHEDRFWQPNYEIRLRPIVIEGSTEE